MKKLFLILSLILLCICLFSCDNQQINTDTDTDTNASMPFDNFKTLEYMIENSENFKCRVEIGQETFYISGNDAKELYALVFEKFSAGIIINGTIDTSIARLQFMSDINDDGNSYFTWKDGDDLKYWYGEIFLANNNTACFSSLPVISYMEKRELLANGEVSAILNYINSIK